MENEQVLSDGNVICEECSEEDLKVGEEEWKDHSSDTKNGRNVYKHNASDKSQTSDLGVSSDLSISNTGYTQTCPIWGSRGVPSFIGILI